MILIRIAAGPLGGSVGTCGTAPAGYGADPPICRRRGELPLYHPLLPVVLKGSGLTVILVHIKYSSQAWHLVVDRLAYLVPSL